MYTKNCAIAKIICEEIIKYILRLIKQVFMYNIY
jgi:hypothetical protein